MYEAGLWNNSHERSLTFEETQSQDHKTAQSDIPRQRKCLCFKKLQIQLYKHSELQRCCRCNWACGTLCGVLMKGRKQKADSLSTLGNKVAEFQAWQYNKWRWLEGRVTSWKFSTPTDFYGWISFLQICLRYGTNRKSRVVEIAIDHRYNPNQAPISALNHDMINWDSNRNFL